MKYLYLCVLGMLALYNPCWAQYPLKFTLHQLPGLTVDAGKDSLVKKGQSIRLNATATGGSGNYHYRWQPATGLDSPEVAHPLATVNDNITYTVSVSDSAGCSKSATVQLKLQAVTAVSALELALGFRVFPNPSRGIFIVSTQQPFVDMPIQLQVFNPFGQEVYSNTIRKRGTLYEHINLPGLAPGIYILNITGRKVFISHKIQIF
jgi:hypothetical protein